MEQSLAVAGPVEAVATAEGTAASARAVDVVTAAYDEYQRELYSFALRTAGDPAAAEDTVQEAFLRLTGEVSRRRTPDNVRAWLFRVVANLLVSRGRRARVADRFRHLFVSREIEQPPDSALLRRERSTALEVELARLRPEARAGLLMAAQGFSMREIGAALGRSEGATRALLCRARLALRRELEASGAFDEHA